MSKFSTGFVIAGALAVGAAVTAGPAHAETTLKFAKIRSEFGQQPEAGPQEW